MEPSRAPKPPDRNAQPAIPPAVGPSGSPRELPGQVAPEVIRPVRKNEIDQALRLLLANPDEDAGGQDQKIQSFRELAQREQYDLSRQVVVIQNELVVFTCLFVPNPGATAFVFLANPPQLPGVFAAPTPSRPSPYVLALKQLCQWAAQDGCNLLQVLVEPGHPGRQRLSLEAGFRYLTDLIYMFVPSDATVPDFIPPPDIQWLTYSAQSHELFKKIIAQTYIHSPDCPELEHLRDMEDVLRGHQASGIFYPVLWKLLSQNHQPVGVVLLSPLRHTNTMEITYMGLVPSARGHQLGMVLLMEAASCALQYDCQCLTLAVDHRNQPAYRLYKRFGFHSIAKRRVLYFSTTWEGRS